MICCTGYGADQEDVKEPVPVQNYHVPEEIKRFIHYFHQHIIEQVLQNMFLFLVAHSVLQ